MTASFVEIRRNQRVVTDKNAVTDAHTLVVSSSGAAAVTWTQTVVALAAATSGTLIAANASRKALRWMNVGLNPVTIVPELVVVTAGNGMQYNPPLGAGYQGGGEEFSGQVSTQAFSAFSTLGTSVVVWEGV